MNRTALNSKCTGAPTSGARASSQMIPLLLVMVCISIISHFWKRTRLLRDLSEARIRSLGWQSTSPCECIHRFIGFDLLCSPLLGRLLSMCSASFLLESLVTSPHFIYRVFSWNIQLLQDSALLNIKSQETHLMARVLLSESFLLLASSPETVLLIEVPLQRVSHHLIPESKL